jgi:thioredoxin-like negative regulator of GroEL
MGLMYLQSSNFGVDQTKHGQAICTSIKGISVVLFYSPTKCQYSPAALQEFKRVAGTVNGVLLCVVNIDNNMDIVRQSRKTQTPIDGVPYIMLYENGAPVQIYPESYPFTADSIRQFIVTVSTNLVKMRTQAQQVSTARARPSAPQQKSGTIYYISSPRKRDSVTYFKTSEQMQQAVPPRQ